MQELPCDLAVNLCGISLWTFRGISHANSYILDDSVDCYLYITSLCEVFGSILKALFKGCLQQGEIYIPSSSVYIMTKMHKLL